MEHGPSVLRVKAPLRRVLRYLPSPKTRPQNPRVFLGSSAFSSGAPDSAASGDLTSTGRSPGALTTGDPLAIIPIGDPARCEWCGHHSVGSVPIAKYSVRSVTFGS